MREKITLVREGRETEERNIRERERNGKRVCVEPEEE